MFYLADIGNIGILIALIWWIASSLLGKKNKRKKIQHIEDVNETESSQKKPGIFDWLPELEKKPIEDIFPDLFKVEQEEPEFEIPEVEDIADEITVEPPQQSVTDEIVVKHESILHPDTVQSYTHSKLRKKLQDKNELQQAILLKEILDKPVALRKFFTK